MLPAPTGKLLDAFKDRKASVARGASLRVSQANMVGNTSACQRRTAWWRCPTYKMSMAVQQPSQYLMEQLGTLPLNMRVNTSFLCSYQQRYELSGVTVVTRLARIIGSFTVL